MLFWTWSSLVHCAVRQFGSLPAGPCSPTGPPPPLLPKRALYIGRLTHGLSQPASLLRGASAPGLGIVSVGLRSPHFAAQTLGYWFLMAVERCFAVIGQRLTPLFGARHDRVEEEVLDINQQASGSSTAMLEKSPATLASPQYMGTSYRACGLPRIRSEWAFEARSATRLEQYVGATGVHPPVCRPCLD